MDARLRQDLKFILIMIALLLALMLVSPVMAQREADTIVIPTIVLQTPARLFFEFKCCPTNATFANVTGIVAQTIPNAYLVSFSNTFISFNTTTSDQWTIRFGVIYPNNETQQVRFAAFSNNRNILDQLFPTETDEVNLYITLYTEEPETFPTGEELLGGVTTLINWLGGKIDELKLDLAAQNRRIDELGIILFYTQMAAVVSFVFGLFAAWIAVRAVRAKTRVKFKQGS